jgi:hypothetical protein
MNTTYPSAGFTKEGEGYSLDMLSTTWSPVYYGFNCRPRQIKYRPIEKSCENILSGKTSMSVAKAYYAKLFSILKKANETTAQLKAEANYIQEKINKTNDTTTRQLLKKERNRIENKIWGDLDDKVRSLKHFAENINNLIKLHDTPLTNDNQSGNL